MSQYILTMGWPSVADTVFSESVGVAFFFLSLFLVGAESACPSLILEVACQEEGGLNKIFQ